MADKSVTLPDSDWQILMMGLYELPMKLSAPVAARLQQALTESMAQVEPLHAVPKEASDG